MNVDYIIKEKANDFFYQIANSPVNNFSPNKFAKFSGMSLEEAFKFLLNCIDSKELNVTWELRCPNCGKLLPLNCNHDTDEMECLYCDEEFNVDKYDLYAKFSLTKEYKNHLISKKKL